MLKKCPIRKFSIALVIAIAIVIAGGVYFYSKSASTKYTCPTENEINCVGGGGANSQCSRDYLEWALGSYKKEAHCDFVVLE